MDDLNKKHCELLKDKNKYAHFSNKIILKGKIFHVAILKLKNTINILDIYDNKVWFYPLGRFPKN